MKEYKSLNELNLLDRFLFDEAAEDPDFLKAVLEIVLGKDISIEGLPQSEKEQRLHLLSKHIRLDIWAQDESGTIYDTEVQKKNTYNLPRRTRYYHDLIGAKLLPVGELDYNKLNDVYVIIISPFDVFGMGLHKYTFRMRCDEDRDIVLDDGAVTIFLNTRGTCDDIDVELKNMLKYFESSTDDVADRSGSDRIEVLRCKVNEIRRNEEIGVKYMLAWEEKILDKQEARAEGLAEGREEGRAKGLAEGREEGRAKGLAEGREEGRAKGLAEGRAEGRADGLTEGRDEKAKEIATKMKAKGMTSAEIADLTGLSEEQIEAL